MTDAYSLIVVEIVILTLLVLALVMPRLHQRGVGISVKRGPESRQKFGVAYGFGSILLLQLINVSEAFVGHKVLLSLLNLAALFYLCFFSSWFRNKIVGWISVWEKTPEA